MVSHRDHTQRDRGCCGERDVVEVGGRLELHGLRCQSRAHRDPKTTRNRESTHRLPVKVGLAARRDGGGRDSREMRSGEAVVGVVEPSSHRELRGGCNKGYKEQNTSSAAGTSGLRSRRGRNIRPLYRVIDGIHVLLRGGTLVGEILPRKRVRCVIQICSMVKGRFTSYQGIRNCSECGTRNPSDLYTSNSGPSQRGSRQFFTLCHCLALQFRWRGTYVSTGI